MLCHVCTVCWRACVSKYLSVSEESCPDTKRAVKRNKKSTPYFTIEDGVSWKRIFNVFQVSKSATQNRKQKLRNRVQASSHKKHKRRILSKLAHPTSNIQHPTSNIQHPTSNIQHPTSNIQHPTPNPAKNIVQN